MKICYGCGKVTTGKPSYCHYCGKTYDVRLCPRGHINPRSANVCSECGNKELSMAQPRVPLLLRPLLFLMSHLVGVALLVALLLFVAVFIHKLFTDPNGLLPLMCIGLYLCLAFFVWMMLPNFLRKGIARLVSRKGRKH
jgi:hypothetical protein